MGDETKDNGAMQGDDWQAICDCYGDEELREGGGGWTREIS